MPLEPQLEQPRDLGEAFALLAGARGSWRPLAGGTDVLVQLAGGTGEPSAGLVDIWRLDELRGIADERDALVIGALTTYTEIRRSATVAERLPVLALVAAAVGAPQIQNRGTIGGNVMTASPAGDTLPILLATGAQMVLASARGERAVGAESFWTGYRRTARRDDELLTRIRVPSMPERRVRFWKIGTRRAKAISKVVLALAWRTDGSGRWRDVRLALGSVAATVVRATRTEEIIEGSLPTREIADEAGRTLAAELVPIDDVRSTAEYRRAVAARALHRLIREAGGW